MKRVSRVSIRRRKKSHSRGSKTDDGISLPLKLWTRLMLCFNHRSKQRWEEFVFKINLLGKGHWESLCGTFHTERELPCDRSGHGVSRALLLCASPWVLSIIPSRCIRLQKRWSGKWLLTYVSPLPRKKVLKASIYIFITMSVLYGFDP